MKQEKLNSNILYDKLISIENSTKDAIATLMKENCVTEVDLTLDKEGRSSDCKDYDEEWVMDNRAWTVCFGKYYYVEGYVSKVRLFEDCIDITSKSNEGSEEFSHDYTDTSCGVLIDVLRALERMFNN